MQSNSCEATEPDARDKSDSKDQISPQAPVRRVSDGSMKAPPVPSDILSSHPSLQPPAINITTSSAQKVPENHLSDDEELSDDDDDDDDTDDDESNPDFSFELALASRSMPRRMSGRRHSSGGGPGSPISSTKTMDAELLSKISKLLDIFPEPPSHQLVEGRDAAQQQPAADATEPTPQRDNVVSTLSSGMSSVARGFRGLWT
jgi:hypothetical protein